MGIKPKPNLLVVDGGGSGCRAALFNHNGDRLANAETGPANVFTDLDRAVENVLEAVQLVANTAGLKAEDLCHCVAHIGLAGLLEPAQSDTIAAALPFHSVTLSDDRATSLAGALGDADGVLAAIGTGTAIAAQSGGTVRTFGGWGHVLDDTASGCWLGQSALRKAILAHDGLVAGSDLTHFLLDHFNGSPAEMARFAKAASPVDFASFAPHIVEEARKGDLHAKALMQDGATYLMMCLTATGFQPDSVLCLTGGVGPHYAAYLPDPIKASLQPAAGSALDGALRLARQTYARSGGAP